MSEAFPWYTSVTESQLEQGDLLLGCPSFQRSDNASAFQDKANVVVMTVDIPSF